MNHCGKPHLLRILDHEGHTQLSFDPEDEKAVRDVNERFVELMERGFVAFDVSTHPGRVMKNFDPDAKEIIVSPRFAGG